MSEQKLQLDEAIKVIRGSLEVEELSNEDVVKIILVWENNPFVADQMRELLLKNSKETNIETLLNKLKQRYDIYTVSYITFLPLYKKNVVRLNGNFQAIVEDLLVDFDLTNLASEPERNREQVEQLALNEELRQSCYDYINDRVFEILEDDENIEDLTTTIFTAVMFEMLYIKVAPIGLDGYEKLLNSFES